MRIALTAVLTATAVMGALHLTGTALNPEPRGAMAPTQQTLSAGVTPGLIDRDSSHPPA